MALRIVECPFLQWQGGTTELIWPKEFATADLVYPAPPWESRQRVPVYSIHRVKRLVDHRSALEEVRLCDLLCKALVPQSRTAQMVHLWLKLSVSFQPVLGRGIVSLSRWQIRTDRPARRFVLRLGPKG